MRISIAYSIEFSTLSRRKFLLRIEAPASFEQPLSSQDLVNTRDAAVKSICRIENGGVCVGNLLRERQVFWRNRVAMSFSEGQMRYRGFRPHRPVPKKTACKLDLLCAQTKWRKQID